ncbi:MAG: septal ring lytic transglycosylase RlpA family protein [Zoogloeaceae bacterium]|nr:septal ring lytic transglycosylase RlpA family protein [Zoogloeaceae bacterium]
MACLLTACGTLETRVKPGTVIQTARTIKSILDRSGGGGYYKDDGPADEIPVDLDAVPNAQPRRESLHKGASKPYEVLGKKYTPQTEIRPFRQEGVASWYGKKFHGQKTSIGDTYDMFAMTAAHPTLPLPSYARVTNPANGRMVVVRLNDRGPFHSGRIIDLSYVAAYKLGYVENGSAHVIVETIIPDGDPLPPVTPAATMVASATPPDSAELDTLSQQLTTVTDDVASAPLPAPGIFLQLGAFTSAENAENLRNHLSRELDWLTAPLRIHKTGNFHRLQLGPCADRASAEQIARRIESALGFTPAIVIAR